MRRSEVGWRQTGAFDYGLGSTMRSSLRGILPLLAALAVAVPASAATSPPAETPPTAATPSPALTPPTSATSATSMPSAAPSLQTSPPPPSPRPTLRRTPSPTASPEPDDVDATPGAMPDDRSDDAAPAVPPGQLIPTAVLAAGVRTFRTPERDEPPAFVAPQVEAPGPEDAQGEPTATESPVPEDRPYVATVTFHVTATTDIDGFELLVIYPRSAGEFIRSDTGLDCRKSGDATMFANDSGGGTLQLLVASDRPIAFPFDIVCRFTVEPNAALTTRLIAVNVAEATIGGKGADLSALSVSVNAH